MLMLYFFHQNSLFFQFQMLLFNSEHPGIGLKLYYPAYLFTVYQTQTYW